VEPCRIEGAARVTVPLRVRPKRSKTILAVYKRLRDHYYLALAPVEAGTGGYRWEPHLIVDRAGLLNGDRGVMIVSGPLVLLRYEGLRDMLEAARRAGCLRAYHLAPWGLPAVLAIDARPLDEEEQAFLERVDVESARRALEEIVRKTRVEEV